MPGRRRAGAHQRQLALTLRMKLDADPQAVRQLVYIVAMVPLPGEGWGDKHSAEVVAARTASAKANDHALPPPDPTDFGITGAAATG